MYNCHMFSPRYRRLIGLIILLVSLTILIWGIWPFGEMTRNLLIPPANMQLPTPTSLLFGYLAM